MFNVTGGEVMIILVIALVVLGPEKLPDMIRKAGRLYGEVRRMANGFQSELRDAFDEPTRELRETAELARNAMTGAVTDMTSVVQNTFKVDPDPVPTPTEPYGEVRQPELQPATEVTTSPFDGKELSAAAPEPVPPLTQGFGGLNVPTANGDGAAVNGATGAPVPLAEPGPGAVAASLPTPLPPPPPPPPSPSANPTAADLPPLAAPLPPPPVAANGDR